MVFYDSSDAGCATHELIVMQIVYISNRPELLENTLVSVASLMPFVKSGVVLTSSRLADKFIFPTGLEMKVLTEEQCLGFEMDDFLKTTHHQEKSFLLRNCLVQSDAVEDVFIMSDDDYRPMRPLDSNYFHRDGMDNGFYFYDLLEWPSRFTDYDKGLIWTGRFLKSNGYSTLAYSSHMPQIVRKKYFIEAMGVVRNIAGEATVPADEWSIYFNYVSTVYPNEFDALNPYETMNWPPLPTDWKQYTAPPNYSFENYYPEFYGSGRIFDGLSHAATIDNWNDLFDMKVARREAMEKSCQALKNGMLFPIVLSTYRTMGSYFPLLANYLKGPVSSIARKIFKIK